jgi:phosphoribosylformimino-5-aminoimidazole carboxamide ribotide isomerase
MLIPSIDLMGGKIVQLVQGERKALEFQDFDQWSRLFKEYPIVQLIDLDAAMGKGENNSLVRRFCAELPCQVGGGIRSVERANELLHFGAKKVIIGSALFNADGVNFDFAQALSAAIGAERLIFSVDARAGYVAVNGWKKSTQITPAHAIGELQDFCSGFLYTNIDTEGLMQGFPLQVLDELRAATNKKLIVAGGITTREEVAALDAMGVDAVVGMAIYTGKMKV